MSNITKTAQKVSQTLPQNLKQLQAFHNKNMRNVRIPVIAKTAPATKAGVVIALVTSVAALVTVVAVSAHTAKYERDREYRRKVDEAAAKAEAKKEELKNSVAERVEETREALKEKADEVKDKIHQSTEEATEEAKQAVDDTAEEIKP